MSIWLGLFAMLMIHAGPLYSAWQMERLPAQPEAHLQHGQGATDASAQPHHGMLSTDEPAWLAALALCGYCDLLTLNPPLNLSLDLVLPRHGPARFAPLPDAPWREDPRPSTNQARAPPRYFPS